MTDQASIDKEPRAEFAVSLRQLDPAVREQLEPKTSKGRRSRAALQQAAREVFRLHGYANARVVDMAETAAFSLGAYYRYFRDKRDILMSLLEQLFTDMYAFARAPWQPGDPRQSVYLTTVKYLELYRDNVDLYRVMIEASTTEELIAQVWQDARRAFYGRIARALRRGQSQGDVPPELNPEITAALLGGMTEHYAYLMFVSQDAPEDDIEEVSRHIADLWAYGTSAGVPRRAHDG